MERQHAQEITFFIHPESISSFQPLAEERFLRRFLVVPVSWRNVSTFKPQISRFINVRLRTVFSKNPSFHSGMKYPRGSVDRLSETIEDSGKWKDHCSDRLVFENLNNAIMRTARINDTYTFGEPITYTMDR